MTFYREKKQTNNIKNSYSELIKGFDYASLLEELQKVNNRIFKDKITEQKQAGGKFDRVKGNSFEIDKWKKVQLLNLIQKKYNRRF
jgi:hypothetical protein